MPWHWIPEAIGRFVDVICSWRRRRVHKRFGELHRRGHELLEQVNTQPMHIHEAQRLVVDWIDTVAGELRQKVSPLAASRFVGDFETRKRIWQERWNDRVLREIDEIVQTDEKAQTTNTFYHYELDKVMKEKIRSLEDVTDR